MLALCASVLSASPAPLYTPTPYGHVLSHCVHEVPSGARVTEISDGSMRVVAPDASVTFLPKCDQTLGPMRKPNKPADAEKGLPADYDGWLEYTALNTSALGLAGGFDAYTSVMSVPDVPKRMADQLFLFPGLQNRDWVPKVDPLPTRDSPFDIIQPVLQYPGAGLFARNHWSLKSWYVTVNAGALYSSPINHIAPGDAVLCNMTRTGPTSWRVSGALRSDPSKATVQEASAPRLKLQPWAYSAVAECYGCKGCETYPTTPVLFSDNKLYVAGELVDVPAVAWKINPKPAAQLMCNESTSVAANGDATISFL